MGRFGGEDGSPLRRVGKQSVSRGFGFRGATVQGLRAVVPAGSFGEDAGGKTGSAFRRAQPKARDRGEGAREIAPPPPGGIPAGHATAGSALAGGRADLGGGRRCPDAGGGAEASGQEGAKTGRDLVCHRGPAQEARLAAEAGGGSSAARFPVGQREDREHSRRGEGTLRLLPGEGLSLLRSKGKSEDGVLRLATRGSGKLQSGGPASERVLDRPAARGGIFGASARASSRRRKRSAVRKLFSSRAKGT